MLLQELAQTLARLAIDDEGCSGKSIRCVLKLVESLQLNHLKDIYWVSYIESVSKIKYIEHR